MAKKIDSYVKLNLKAQEATAAPPVGPALGPRGVNSAQFVKDFNAYTQSMAGLRKGIIVPVVITIYSDKSYSFIVKTSPAPNMLKEILGLSAGSSKPKLQMVGTVTVSQLEAIAKTKLKDMTAGSLQAAIRTIAGTARSMGIAVEEEIV